MERETLHRKPRQRPLIEDEDLIIELQTYLNLDIDGRDLENEVLRQPTLFYKAAVLLASAATVRDRAKVALENLEAETAQSIRDHVPASTKLTVGEIEARVRLHPAVKKQRDVHIEAIGMHGKMAALKEGYTSRGWSLRDAVELQNRAQSQIDVEAHKAEANRQRRDYFTQHEGKF